VGVRAHVVVHGRVQGVWYRGSMQEEAERLRVGGWVRNRPDGTVEAEIEGERADVDAMIAWARYGPPGARVVDVSVEWVPPTGTQGGFAVRR
jgi:acylphosphatase